jgi:2'-hydroxyisoflavone reductase
MKVLVIGGTGYIGSHAVGELARRDHEVSVFARGITEPQLPEGVSLIKGNRHNPEELARLRPHGFEAVIDINAYTREETQSAINTFDGTLTRFVHLSTISVYQLASKMPIVESDPLVTDPGLHYGYNKAECERALRWAHAKNGFPFVSIRPPAVFGPGDDKSRENYFLKRLVAGEPVIIAGSGATPIFSIYVKDLAVVLADALTAEGVTGSAFHVAQYEAVSLNDHVDNIASLAGLEADIARVPFALLERLGFNLHQLPYYAGDRLIICDTQAARNSLGFAPSPYLRALQETVEYFLARGPETQKSIEDRYPPVMPRSRERALADRYRAALRALEDRLTDQWLSEAMPKE